MTTGLYAIVTTIQPPTDCTRRLAEAIVRAGGWIIVAGDKKGPAAFDLPATKFLSLQDQLDLPLSLSKLLPTGHYCRKNIGYLYAFAQGATCIYETDDDNAPNEHWQVRSRQARAAMLAPQPGWFNVYRLFTEKNIWPRGFPLRLILDEKTFRPAGGEALLAEVDAPIQQGLADGSPDVDAVWRLVLDEEFCFDRGPSVFLPPGTWCPFNSQTTWWWPEAYPLIYLPSYCSFRMTDIWRSFIAQRCLWEMGRGLVFHAAEANQLRNVHNLLRDFEDEVPGYLGNEKIVALLEGLSLRAGPSAVCDNLLACYRRLSEAGFFPGRELPLVEAWLADLTSYGRWNA